MLVFVIIAGASIGSFLNVVIHRLPLMMYKDWNAQCKELQNEEIVQNLPTDHISLASPGSRCPSCNHPIHPLQNIPVISFLALGGKCKQCHASISPRYFFIEVSCALLAGFIAYTHGISATTLFYCVFTFLLVPMIFIDIEHKLLPDDLTYLLLWTGIVFSLSGHGIALEQSIYGVIVGYLSLWSVYITFKLLTGKEGMGHGDFKLLAALGAWLGWQQLLLVILISSLSGTILTLLLLSRKNTHKDAMQSAIPFGPYLALGGWITLIWGTELTSWYLSKF